MIDAQRRAEVLQYARKESAGREPYFGKYQKLARQAAQPETDVANHAGWLELVAWAAALLALVGYVIATNNLDFLVDNSLPSQQTPADHVFGWSVFAASACLVSAVGPVLATLRWRRNGRRRDWTSQTSAAFPLVTAALCSVQVAPWKDAAAQAEPFLSWATLPAILLGAASLIVQYSAAAVEQQPDDDEVWRLRNAAFEILHERGLISEATLAQISAMPLDGFEQWAWQRHQASAPKNDRWDSQQPKYPLPNRYD